MVLWEISKWAEKVFFFLDNFILKAWISKRVFYFVSILRRFVDIFLLDCSQVLSLLNLGFRSIFEPRKSPIQRG